MNCIQMFSSECLLVLGGDDVDGLCRITIATLLSFVAAALASTHRFCYSAVASSSVVLILPVWLPHTLTQDIDGGHS